MRFIKGLPRFATLAGILLLALFVFGGCSTDNEEDECDKTKEDLIEPLFRIHVVALEPGDVPYTGEIDFQSQKHYCDGTVKGIFTDHIESTPGGVWTPITTQYKLENQKDFVLIIFSSPTDEISHSYYYKEVSNGMELEDYTTWVFEDTLYLDVQL